MAEAESTRLQTMTQDLRELVSELMKNSPDTRSVKKLSEKTGIHYSEDPIELMSTVLKAINSACTQLSGPRRPSRSEETSL